MLLIEKEIQKIIDRVEAVNKFIEHQVSNHQVVNLTSQIIEIEEDEKLKLRIRVRFEELSYDLEEVLISSQHEYLIASVTKTDLKYYGDLKEIIFVRFKFSLTE